MKLLFTSFFFLAFSLLSFSQVPQSFSYQAIARNASGNGIANQNIGLRISILQGSPTGSSVYTETHTALTDANGVLNLAIGTGAVTTGAFSTINWSQGAFFVQIEMDVTGGTTYVLMGTSQLLSVPYALYAGGVNLTKGNQAMDLYIGDDGGVYALKKITVEKPYALQPTVTDIDGNSYSTVKIGTQVWMAENLRTTKLNDGTVIPNVIDGTNWNNLTTTGRCAFNNTTNSDSINTFGLIYNAYTIQTNKLCPTGWHIPTSAEFQILITYLGPLAGFRMKSNLNWPNTNTINDAGFDAYSSGTRSQFDSNFIRMETYWWTSTQSTENPNSQYTYLLTSFPFYYGTGARCIKD
jgi:uncharacterized protein (TIGR02145 family)